MENEKVYASQQLICMLPPLALKILLYLINWQHVDNFKYFPKSTSEYLHLDQSELDLGIQTLVDNHILDVSLIDGIWCFNLNKKVINEYYNVKMETVKNHEGLKLPTEITWDKVDEPEKKQSNSIDDMTDEQMLKMVQILQARLSERKQVKELVKNNASANDGLPF